MIFDCDIAIVGGGPAGSAAAIWSAVRGLDAILIESEAFPRHRPGESLHPGVEPLLQQLQVLDAVSSAGFRRYAGHWVTWAGKTAFQPFGGGLERAWLGFQATRSEFDAILLNRAKSLGVRVLQPARAGDALYRAGRIAGVRCNGTEIRSRFVIDASGRRQWLQRQIGLCVRRFSPPLIAAWGYGRGVLPHWGDHPRLTGHGNGWSWMAPIQDDLFSWTRLDFGCPILTPPWPASQLEPVGRTKAADVTWRLVPPSSGDGFFVTGDAASVMDPAASHGVLKALMSGVLAADLAARVKAGVIDQSNASDAFRGWTRKWFLSDVRRLRNRYADLRPAPL